MSSAPGQLAVHPLRPPSCFAGGQRAHIPAAQELTVKNIFYIIGVVVVVLAILGFLGFR